MRGPAEPRSHDAVGVEEQGGGGLRHVEPGGEIGAASQVEVDVPRRRRLAGDEPSSRAVAGHLAQNSVENCTTVAASPRGAGPSSACRTCSPEPACARPCRDCQNSPVVVAAATSTAPTTSAAGQSMVRA